MNSRWPARCFDSRRWYNSTLEKLPSVDVVVAVVARYYEDRFDNVADAKV